MTEREELLVAQQQVIRLEALLDASRRIHSTTDLDTVLRTALRIVVQELELIGACFSHFPYCHGTMPESLTCTLPAESENQPPAMQESSEQSADTDTGFGGATEQRFTLYDKDGELLTELIVLPPKDRELTPDEVDFLEGLALQAGVAIENARFHERTLLMAQLREEREKAWGLLLNILPKSVAEDLQNGHSVPMFFEDATICFTDFVNFTLSTEKMPPQRVVEQLHIYFTAFDEVMERYGLEKLKTIGDSYMFASGLPVKHPAHPVNAVLAALELGEIVRRLADGCEAAGWAVRVGLHTGPVIAGVVGVRKFAFDIWGNSVNFASRMESSGLPGSVNISAATYERVRDFFYCEPRGKILTKDKREVEMYLVRGISDQLCSGGARRAFERKYQERFGEPLRCLPDFLCESIPGS
jgi:adenylate cyclase